MQLWVCGQIIGDPTNPEAPWELSGIFDSKDKAISACRDQSYFIAPMTLNEQVCHESQYFPECEYPLWSN